MFIENNLRFKIIYFIFPGTRHQSWWDIEGDWWSRWGTRWSLPTSFTIYQPHRFVIISNKHFSCIFSFFSTFFLFYNNNTNYSHLLILKDLQIHLIYKWKKLWKRIKKHLFPHNVFTSHKPSFCEPIQCL